MKFMNQARFYARRYRNEAGADGVADSGAAAVTGVQTEDDTGSILTGDQSQGDIENSDAAAAAAGDESGDAAAAAAGDAGAEEGSQLPPDTYADFTVPEGMELNETLLAEATPLFQEAGLTQEQAQKFIDFHAKQVQAGLEKQVGDFNQLMKDWREQSAADKEFGGDNFEKSVKIAQNAINKFGTPELKQLLEDHGMGNHPEMIRFMVRVGQTLKEDVPGASGAPSSPAADRVSLLYPKSENE